jgi:aspartyl-tRNA(Asn)/glutamyl-tRNA(Gln) amidotransferase subunit A
MNGEASLHFHSLAETAADIGAGALSSKQLASHSIERIAALESKLHAFAELRADGALEETRNADRRRAGGDALGALHLLCRSR